MKILLKIIIATDKDNTLTNVIFIFRSFKQANYINKYFLFIGKTLHILDSLMDL